MDVEAFPTLDNPAIFALSLMACVLGGSIILWIRQIESTRRSVVPKVGLPAWSLTWLDFLIWLCALILTPIFFQLIAALILGGSVNESPENGNQEPKLTPWIAVIGVLLLQGPLIAVYYGTKLFFPQTYSIQLNSHSIGLWQGIKMAAPAFIRFLPLIWICSFLWSGLLQILQKLSIIDEFPPQDLISLFAEGGDPVAIGILIIFAVIVAPLVEEIIFRGCIYRFLKGKTTLVAAQVISGLFFAMVHVNLMSFVPLIVVGYLLAVVYEKSGNILVPILFHAFFNGFSLIMLLIVSQSEAFGLK